MYSSRKWTPEVIERECRDMVELLGYFPSAQDMRRLNRNDLACAVSKGGGFVFWSNRIGADRRKSDSDFGWEAEDRFGKKLAAMGYEVQAGLGVKSPCDMIVNGVLRVDVKGANAVSYNGDPPYYYIRIGKYVQSDVVCLYCIDTDDVYVFPWWDTNATNMSVNPRSPRFSWALNAFGILDSMIELRKSERTKFGRNCFEVATA